MYETLKILHLFSLTAWMAGMFYLPRLYVYHAGLAPGSEASETFKVMERKLIKLIMTPAMIATWIFGIGLIHSVGLAGWLYVKIVLVLAMSAIHGFLAKLRKDFEADRNTRTDRYYRVLNEIPTVLFVLILILVVAKPF